MRFYSLMTARRGLFPWKLETRGRNLETEILNPSPHEYPSFFLLAVAIFVRREKGQASKKA